MNNGKLPNDKDQNELIYSEISFPPPEVDTVPKTLRWGYERWSDRVLMRHKIFGKYFEWTWEQVYDEVKYLCLGLMNFGLQRGETAAIIGENEPEFFWAYWAIQAAGAKTVCIYPDTIPSEATYILNHSEALFVFCEDQEQTDKILEIKEELPKLEKIIYWDDRGMWTYSDSILITLEEVQDKGRKYAQSNPDAFEERLSQGKGADIADISYTSGTTGLPKGVIELQQTFLDNAFRWIFSLPVYPFIEYLSYSPPAWMAEKMLGLSMGLVVPFVINFSEEPETVLENIREVGAGMLFFGVRQWEMMASSTQAKMLDASPLARKMYNWAMNIGRRIAISRLKNKPINPLWLFLYPIAYITVLRPLADKLGLLKGRVAVVGGASMAPELFYFFQAMGVKLRNTYGSSEFGEVTICQGEQYDIETIGTTMPIHPSFGQQIELRVNDNGELLLRGGTGFAGYYKDPDKTSEILYEGWYHTGDCVTIRDNGGIVYLDRIKDMRTLSTGTKFPPQFIETRLRFSPFIKDAICLGDEKKPFVAALMNIDAETVGRWAEQRGIAYSTFPDLSQNAAVCELIRQEISKVNQDLFDDAKVKRFVNLPKELDPDEAELTRTRKLRRSFLEERYGGITEAIYRGETEFVTEVPVKYRDGRGGKVTATTKIVELGAPKEGAT